MKHFFLFLLTVVVLNRFGVARPAPAAWPADTVRGQARLTQQLSASLCTRLLAESQHTTFTALTPAQGQVLMARLLLGAVADNATALTALLEPMGPTRGRALKHTLTDDAVLRMAQQCPLASTLIAHLSQQQAHIAISDDERPTLLPVARLACRCLDTAAVRQPFAQLSLEARTALSGEAIRYAAQRNQEALLAQYGEALANDSTLSQQVGEKVTLLMLEICPAYLLQLTRDYPAPAAPKASPLTGPNIYF
ncbi:hypothetical protein [Hymenobacter sp. BRD67]|uniref:hypothetical protein n=1 Tax=Hymenobacter sp. BRD67 TaxID=2675877 RepID=UPI001567108C|nr:hypothetical protein [Hymenobacter sp. BRD67]QKG54149.1 hypothetical protein GKZ67_18045 [Hymenobacter sp. BRD67]